MVGVQPSRNRCSAGILMRNFASTKQEKHKQRENPQKPNKRRSSSRTYAMRTVEFKTQMSGGEGAQLPRAPYPGSDYASVNVLLRHQQKGDISNEA